jgi:PhzF family phenazine biosynthesis protein
MNINKFKCFGSTLNTGNEVLVITDSNLNIDERLSFTFKQGNSASVFMEEYDGSIILDYYYPHARSILCLHATMAAGYLYFKQHTHLSSINVITSMNKQNIQIEKRDNGIFLHVKPQPTKNLAIDAQLLHDLLNLDQSQINSTPVIASVGSPKLLIEVNTLATLNHLQPNLDKINLWSKTNAISGCFVYYKSDEHNCIVRNFNHLNPLLEDVATGVSAGALATHLKRDINLHQGSILNNPCLIQTKFLGDMVLVGGRVSLC